jgi:hypothetical protein
MIQGNEAEGTGGDRRLAGSLLRTLGDLLVHPDRTMAALSQSVDLRQGALIVGLLTLVSTILGVVIAFDLAPVFKRILENAFWYTQSERAIRRDLLNAAIALTLVGIPMRWALVTGLLHGLAKALGGSGSYRSMLGLIAYASTPTIITTTASIMIRILAFAFAGLGGAKETADVELWFLPLWCVGMAWGSPGVLSHYSVRHGEGLSRGRALVVTVLAAVLLLAAAYWLLMLALD